jgi:hypothetical protein
MLMESQMTTFPTPFTAEQKSQLAKLMATENLTVQHQKISTAKFDVKNRILYLPIWQDMSSFLYDHLAGHEVGHALYTPAEGWHDAVVDNSKGRGYKSFLNIVEDARIEKKVKRKFPGLRQSFVKSFGELMNRDFFGIAGRDMNRLPFIDRANLYSKSQYTIDLDFSDREAEFIDRLQNTETWEDVVRLTNEIYEYAKNEEPELESGQDFMPSSSGDDEEGAEYDYEPGDDEESDDSEESEEGDSDSEDSEDSEDSGDDDEESESDSKAGDEESDEDEDEDESKSQVINREKKTQESDGEDAGPFSETDENYRRNEASLLDESSLDYVYLNLPKPNLDQIVTPAKRVQELLSQFYEDFSTEELMRNEMNEFKRKNERYVALLAKEFEMKKAAKAYAKRKVSDTGDIDINKISGYQFNDNIFRKLTKVSKGKSHGLVLLLDYSGSMGDNMAGSIEQILVLSMFCRKVNIPFVVYTFGNYSHSRSIDFPDTPVLPCFDYSLKSLKLGQVRLREWMNSRMSNAEYSKAMRNLIMLRKSFESTRHGYRGGRPASETLSNTPMLESIVALQPIVKDFTRVNNLDLTNLVIVQDGDADMLDDYIGYDERFDRRTTRRIWSATANYFLEDKSAKFVRKIYADGNNYTKFTRSMTSAILAWFSETTGSKVFGFYVVPGTISNMSRAVQYQYFDEQGRDVYEIVGSNKLQEAWEKSRELAKKLRREKFLVSNKKSYNGFYMIPGGKDLMTEEGELEVEGKVTASKLKTAFLKMNEKRQLNRVLVSTFIDGIAA